VSRSLLALALACLLAPPANGQLNVGVAEADVTPRVGVPLAGYGGRLRLLRKRGPDLNPFNDHALFEASTGVRDPIEAQCLVFERGDQRAALLTLDAIGVEQGLVDDVRRAARRRGVPLSDGRLHMAASHTHSGPGALSRRLLWQVAACDRFNRRVHRGMVDALADLVVEAWEGRRPATLASGAVEVLGVSRNRRAGRSERLAPGDVDPRLRALRVDDAATGEPLAVLMNFAVHPTCLGDDNLELSADVAGAIRREAKRLLGYPVLFTNGCEGDVSPNPGGEGGLRVVGQRLGAALAELAPRAKPLGSSLATAQAQRELGPLVFHPTMGEGDDSVAGPLLAAIKRLGPNLREPIVTTRFRYAALRLGSLILLFVPGEPIGELGRQLEADAQALGFDQVWVVGLANGHMGYVTTPEEYDQGGYEAWLTFYGRDTSQRLREAFQEALAPLAPH
jgi:hypothetical protein